MTITKLTVNLPTASVELLKVYAVKRGITMTEAVRRTLGLQAFLAKEESQGAKILLEKGGELRQLVW